MVEEDRVQHVPRRRVEAERDVRQAQDDLALGHARAEIALDRVQRPLSPSLRSSSLPVQIVKVSGSNSRSFGGRPCWLHGEIVEPLGDLAACLRPSFAMPCFVDRQRDHRRAELLGELQALVGRLLAVLEIDRVDDRLAAIELAAPLPAPGIRSNSMTSGALTAPRMRVTTSFISATSSRPTKAVQTSSVWLPSLTCSRPISTQPSQSPLLLQARGILRAVGVAALADRQIGVLLAQRALGRRARRPRASSGACAP